MAARKRESEGRNSDPGRLHSRFGAGSVLALKNKNIYQVFAHRRSEIAIFTMIVPTTLVDGFSKLWLRGKGNLGVETLIPAGSMMLGLMLGLVLALKNSNIYRVFRMLDSETSKKLIKKLNFLDTVVQK